METGNPVPDIPALEALNRAELGARFKDFIGRPAPKRMNRLRTRNFVIHLEAKEGWKAYQLAQLET